MRGIRSDRRSKIALLLGWWGAYIGFAVVLDVSSELVEALPGLAREPNMEIRELAGGSGRMIRTLRAGAGRSV